MFKIAIYKRLYISGKGRRAALAALIAAGGFINDNAQRVFHACGLDHHELNFGITVICGSNRQCTAVHRGGQACGSGLTIYRKASELRVAVISFILIDPIKGHAIALAKPSAVKIVPFLFIVLPIEKKRLRAAGQIVAPNGNDEPQRHHQRQQQTDQFFHHTFLSFSAKRVRFSPLKR